jgi:hypothetical protein
MSPLIFIVDHWHKPILYRTCGGLGVTVGILPLVMSMICPALAELDIVLRRKVQMHIARISGLKCLRLNAIGERDS